MNVKMKTSYCQDVLFSLNGKILQDKTDTAPKEYYCKTGTASIDIDMRCIQNIY